MNIIGFLRGYMSKNMSSKDFIETVIDTISKEFEIKYSLKEVNENYSIHIGEYYFEIPIEEAKKYQAKGAFALDKYILSLMQTKGFIYDVNRSQYIDYYNGIYKNCNIIKTK